MASKKILIQVDLQTKGVDITAGKVVSSINQMEGAQAKLIETTKKAKTQTGLNNAILLETGRLASDVNYGFTAIANNLGQLVTLFASFVETNKGVMASFKELGKSLFGIGGFLIGVQLLISLGPKIFEFLTGVTERTKELAKVQKEASKAAGEQIGKIRTLISVFDSATSSAFEKQQAIDELNRSHKKLNLELDDEGRLTRESKEAIEEYIPMLQQKAKANALMTLIQAKYVELIELETASLGDNITLLDQFMRVLKGMVGIPDGISDMIAKAAERRAEAIKGIKEEIAELTGMFLELDTTGFETNEQKIVQSFIRIGRSITLDDQIKEMTENSKKELDDFGDNFTKFMKQMTKVENIETKTRIKIQNTYADSLRELSFSFKNLGFLTDDMKIAAIVAEKAAEVAKVIIATKASNATITAATNAAVVLNPAMTIPLKARARALKTSNNISSGVNIAAIVASAATGIRAIRAKGNVPTSIGGEGGDAGAGPAIEAPDFNVVGVGGVSQLAAGLAGITGKPIQAFVVSKEISSAQELDRNITNNASLG